jgi:hypothetical protein
MAVERRPTLRRFWFTRNPNLNIGEGEFPSLNLHIKRKRFEGGCSSVELHPPTAKKTWRTSGIRDHQTNVLD